MKIVDYETFVRMPAGTIFSPWDPRGYIKDFEIKIDPGKEHEINFADGKRKQWMYNGTCQVIPHIPDDEGYDYGPVNYEFFYYDGSSVDVMDYNMFLIFEEEDIDNMIKVLEWAKKGCPGTDDPNEMLE